jgi:CRISPR-associated protein Cas8a1/Csx13
MDYELKIDLFDPGMGPLHRAGVGGLAATIDKIARKFHPGQLAHDDRTVTLKWDKTQGAKGFFQKLYELSFDIKDGLIHLPGTYASIEPSPIVKAILQQALSQTILQKGPNRKSKGIISKYYEIDSVPMKIDHQYLIGYTHRSAWSDLIDTKGKIKEWVEIGGTIAPGFIERHSYDKFKSKSFINVNMSHAIALHFALVGTVSLVLEQLNQGVMIVPDVNDLNKFAKSRGFLTPTNPRECCVSNPADAAIRSNIHLIANSLSFGSSCDPGFDRCIAVRFRSQTWNKMQKMRSDVIVLNMNEIEAKNPDLTRFEVAMLEIAPRVVCPKQDQNVVPRNKEDTSKKKRTPKNPNPERPSGFWVESVVRPLVAENLAMNRPWYHNFRSLLVGSSDSKFEQRVRQLEYERKGLQAMIDEEWPDTDAEQFVRSIHECMKRRYEYLQSQYQYKTNRTAFDQKKKQQFQKWMFSIINARTPNDFRKAIGEIWIRSMIGNEDLNSNSVLIFHWSKILPKFKDPNGWMLMRDVALLALASFRDPTRKLTSAAKVTSVEDSKNDDDSNSSTPKS